MRIRLTDRDPRWGPLLSDEFLEARLDYGALLKEAAKDASAEKVEKLIEKVKNRQEGVKKETEKEIKERDKKITSENWGHVGFDKTVSL